jgi:hypothetical protein
VPQLPRWWDWPFVLTSHAEFRMEERGLGELEMRTLLQRPDRVWPDRKPGRWRAMGRAGGRRWTVVVEPDAPAGLVLVITAFQTDR